jgi:hypothetical protein
VTRTTNGVRMRARLREVKCVMPMTGMHHLRLGDVSRVPMRLTDDFSRKPITHAAYEILVDQKGTDAFSISTFHLFCRHDTEIAVILSDPLVEPLRVHAHLYFRHSPQSIGNQRMDVIDLTMLRGEQGIFLRAYVLVYAECSLMPTTTELHLAAKYDGYTYRLKLKPELAVGYGAHFEELT